VCHRSSDVSGHKTTEPFPSLDDILRFISFIYSTRIFKKVEGNLYTLILLFVQLIYLRGVPSLSVNRALLTDGRWEQDHEQTETMHMQLEIEKPVRREGYYAR